MGLKKLYYLIDTKTSETLDIINCSDIKKTIKKYGRFVDYEAAPSYLYYNNDTELNIIEED